MHPLSRPLVALAVTAALTGCSSAAPVIPTPLVTNAAPTTHASPTTDPAQKALCAHLTDFSILLLHFNAELGRAVTDAEDGAQKAPDASELSRQADEITTIGTELLKLAPPDLKPDVDTMLKATAEAKAHLKPGDTHGAAADPMYRQATMTASKALNRYAPCTQYR